MTVVKIKALLSSSKSLPSHVMHLQAKEKQIGRLQFKLQRQQSAIEEIEALKVCHDLDPQGVPIPCCSHVL